MEPRASNTRIEQFVGFKKYIVRFNDSAFLRSLFSISLISQQCIATVWFWACCIRDQMHATGKGENTASWLGGGAIFLIITASLQLGTVRHTRNWRTVTQFIIQACSACGGIVALMIFAFRRWSWSPADTLCIAIIVLCVAIWLTAKRPISHKLRLSQSNLATMLIAILFRSTPRVIQGFTLFINNPMSGMTVLSGGYIAAIRLWTLQDTHKYAHGNTERRALITEIAGNTLSQGILTICWIIAIMR